MNKQEQNRNLLAVNALRTLGFPMPNIRKAMHKLTGISQPELARRLGVSRPTVSATIDGTRNSADVQTAIAEMFGVPVETMFQINRPAACRDLQQASNEKSASCMAQA